MSSVWVFLTDTDPKPSGLSDLCPQVRDLVESAGPIVPRDWFRAVNGLSLALVMTGAVEKSSQLLGFSIGIANRLAASHPDAIEFGVEAYLNSIDLLRREDAAAAEQAYRACYDLIQGRPIKKSRTFGLNLGNLNAASDQVRQRSLGIMRYRSHVGLLKLYIADGGPEKAVNFAREVISDFPASVSAGMLQSAEVLAAVEPDAEFLQQFNLCEPRTEGDFVVLLRALSTRPAFREHSRLAEAACFESAVARFQQLKALRNELTPLLWLVYHGVVTERDTGDMQVLIGSALQRCVSNGDRQLYRFMVELAGERFPAPPFSTEAGGAVAGPETFIAPLLEVGRGMTGNESVY
jgi:hypothetical protein